MDMGQMEVEVQHWQKGDPVGRTLAQAMGLEIAEV
jgi:hypothetical protein